MGVRSDLLAATRRNIVNAAMDLFIERGVAATKMDDILNNSGVSVGSFYYLFKNKTDLAAIIYLEIQQQLFEILLDELSNHPGASAKEGIRALLQTYFQWASEHPREMYYLIFCRDPEIKNDEREKTLETEFERAVINWLQPSVDGGDLRSLTPQQCLALLFGPANYLIRSVLDKYDTDAGANNGANHQRLRDDLLNSTEVLIEGIWQALTKAET